MRSLAGALGDFRSSGQPGAFFSSSAPFACLYFLRCETQAADAMAARQLINAPSNVVDEMLEGLVCTQPGLQKLDGYNVIVRSQIDKTKVQIISGGGSGHEPSHAGWVGAGMLSAAVAGPVFASPASVSVLAAIMHVTGSGGCLVIVKNYTGDRLWFGLACEQAKAAGLNVELVVVGDDCALADRGLNIAGRRGVAGTVLVHKIAGAAAEAGASLSEVAAAAREAAAAGWSCGSTSATCASTTRGCFSALCTT